MATPGHSVCKGCGKPIIFGWFLGKHIPLDPNPPVFKVTEEKSMHGTMNIEQCEREKVMVSHFATCPNANDFSGSKRKVA